MRRDTGKMVECGALRYSYKKYSGENTEATYVLALDNIDVNIDKGDFVAILGHNGSGKSTFAKHLNVLLKPDSGKVFVNGMDASLDENIWHIRQTAGMVFQNPDNQLVATVVEEDVAFGAENLGIPSQEIKERVTAALKAVDMEDLRKSTPSLLSGGQKQRVAIAGILAMEPELIILDEPTAMLDPVGRKEVLNTALRLNTQEGVTIIFITHFMEEAAAANRVIVMDDGKIALDGTPKEVFSHVTELKDMGLDVPQVTELAYKLRAMGLPLDSRIITIDEMAEALCQLK